MADEQNPFERDRPEHPDFDLLLEVVTEVLSDRLAQVQSREDKNAVFEQILGEHIDASSASYMALQHAVRAWGIQQPQDVLEKMTDLFRGCSLYLEGLIAGIEFERRRANG